MQTQINKPQELEILPGQIITLSKQNAADFHKQMKEMIKETGYGLFEYVEVVKFFEKLKDHINGNSSSKIPEDKEFIEMIRDEVSKYGKSFTTSRGVKFELAETGSKYDFSKCNDPEISKWETEAHELAEKIKAKQEFLKTVPSKGLEVHTGDGELITIYPPSKTSKSSYKVTLSK